MKDDLMFHFEPEIGENKIYVCGDVKLYVNLFFDKLCSEYDTEPNLVGLIGDVGTLTNIIGRLVQNYEKYKSLNEEFKQI